MAKSKKKPFVTVYGVVAILIVLAILIAATLSPPYGVMLKAAKKAKLGNEFNQVQTAVLGYYTEYSVYPVAADNATLIKMLDGLSSEGNSRQIAFLTFRPSDVDAKGELLDPWGTPIQMSVDADGNLHARSAGPDTTFGTADDIVGDSKPPAAK